MSASSPSSGGTGFLGMLTVLFVGLKLTGYVGWSWWWVFSPLWLPLSILAVILAAVVAIRGRAMSAPSDTTTDGGGAICRCEVPADRNLAFFRSRPDKDADEYFCGCQGWD